MPALSEIRFPSIKQVKSLGFSYVKTYECDEYLVKRYKKGCLEVEFTYIAATNELHLVDVTIDELIAKKISSNNLEKLDSILNQ